MCTCVFVDLQREAESRAETDESLQSRKGLGFFPLHKLMQHSLCCQSVMTKLNFEHEHVCTVNEYKFYFFLNLYSSSSSRGNLV